MKEMLLRIEMLFLFCGVGLVRAPFQLVGLEKGSRHVASSFIAGTCSTSILVVTL